jgi:hypothetical protein
MGVVSWDCFISTRLLQRISKRVFGFNLAFSCTQLRRHIANIFRDLIDTSERSDNNENGKQIILELQQRDQSSNRYSVSHDRDLNTWLFNLKKIRCSLFLVIMSIA